MSFDLLIRGATVVGVGGQRGLDVGIADGLVRGRTVFADGRIVGSPAGRLLTPTTETETP